MSKYKEMIRKTPGDTEWFVHDRFGMFIHFGLYTIFQINYLDNLDY